MKGKMNSMWRVATALVLVLSFSLVTAVPAMAGAPEAPVDLGTASNFAILAKSGISTTGTTSIVGDIGVSPIAATAITGFGLIMDSSNEFSTSSLVTGKVYAADYSSPTPTYLTAAVLDMEAAYTDAAGRTDPNATELGAGNIGGLTLAPGLYKWGTGVTIPTNVTLDAQGDPDAVWIFQIAGTLDISSATSVILSGDAQAKNIFWAVADVVSLGTTSVFNGNILAKTNITMTDGATLNGRALAQTAVTLIANTITMPVAAADDGTGACTVTPLQVVTGSTGNELTFTFATGEEIGAGAISITVPEGWTSPQVGDISAPGYVTADTSGTIAAVPISVSGTDIIVWMTSLGDMGGTITVVYGAGGGDSGATAQATDGTAEFVTKSKVNGGELTPIPDYLQPTVTVGVIALDAPYYEPGDTVTVTVSDMSANTHSGGIDSVEVTAKNSLEDLVEGIVLEETGVNSGVFTGSFGTSDGYPAPEGQLYVEDYEEFDAEGEVISESIVNDRITVTYVDTSEVSHATTAEVNNDWPEVSMGLPAEVTNNDLEYADAEFSTTNPEYGLEYACVIFAVTIDAPEALEADDVVVGQTPDDYAIPFVEVGGNLVGYWGSPVSPMLLPPGLTEVDSLTPFGVKIVDGPLGTYTVTVDLLDLGFPEEGGVAYHGGIERHVLVSVSDTFEVVAAEPLMVTVPESVSVVLPDGSSTIDVTIQGEDFFGPDGPVGSNALDYVDIVVSGPSVSYSLAKAYCTGDSTWDLFDGDLPSGVSGDAAATIKFDVAPNMANEDITVEVTGYTYDDEAETFTEVGEVTKTVSVLGYALYNYPTEDVSVGGDPASLSLDVKTKDGDIVNMAVVVIEADVNAFGKDFDDSGEIEADEKFAQILIHGPHNLITYEGTGETDTYYVNDGHYEVTDITFVDVADVSIVVSDAKDLAAFLDPAFSIIGIGVYDVSLNPATVTAGVATEVVVTVTTVTEDGELLVTEIDSIKLDSNQLLGASTSETGEYTITVPAKPAADTLTVKVTGETGAKYGTATLEVGLPTVSYVITDAADVERNCMLVGAAYDYTIAITALDALVEPLDSGNVWLGTYEEEIFAKLTVVTTLPITLDEDGLGEIVITQDGEELLTAGTLVWKVGSGIAVADAALLLEPSIAVEAPSYTLTWIPEAPEVGEQITFTVSDNYGEPAGDIPVTIVTPSGDPVDKVTTPTGSFKYTPTEAGNYYVSVGEQDPVTVTVVETRLVSIASAPLSVNLDVDGTQQLTITATYEDESAADVTADATYASDDESVATVSDAGLITAVALDEATITVSYTEGVIDVTTDVSVTVGPVIVLESIAASPLSVPLYVGETQQLAITATYSDESEADVTADATYASDDESVATVSDAGLITAVADGVATITVTYTDGVITKTTDVLVTVGVPIIVLYEGANPIYYTGATMDLPGALTNISEITEVIWQRDVSTAGEWWYYLVVLDYGQISQLENDTVYIIVVSEDCTWELSH